MNLPQVYHNPMEIERPDLELARLQLNATLEPNEPFEIRIPNTRRRGPNRIWNPTLSGFFTDVETALSAIAGYTGADAAGIYFTINPLKSYVLNWNHNILGKSVAAAADDDVERIRTLFLDIDPVRPRFTCSTTEEHEAAKRRGNVIVDFVMTECGFPVPVYAGSSGSGATAMWKLEAADSDLVARALAALDIRFTDDVVQVDASVHNAARIARLAGTVNAKSPTPQPDRPWRRATGKAFTSQPVTREQLEALAALAPAEPRKDILTFQPQGDGGSYDLRALLDKAGIPYTEKRRSYGIAFELKQCLTSDQHDTGASFIQMDSGAVTYTCLHNSCGGKGWKDVKHLLGIKRAATVTRSTATTGLFRPIKIGANGLVAS